MSSKSNKTSRRRPAKKAKASKPGKTRTVRFVEKAKTLRLSTEFSERLRKITAFPRDEYDFSSLSEDEAEFAAFWEYRREVQDWYVHTPQRIKGVLWEKWKNNCQFFPMPYLALRRARVLRLGSKLPKSVFRDSPAFRETDGEEFTEILEDSRHPAWGFISKMGTRSVGFPYPSGLGDTAYASAGFLTLHWVVLDWRKGATAIQQQIYEWVCGLAEEQSSLAGQTRNKDKLFQLGAWRAKRFGLSARDYLKLRKREQIVFGKTRSPSYKMPKSFREAASKARKRLHAILQEFPE